MACGKISKPRSERLTSTTTADLFAVVFDWVPCTGLDLVKMVLKLKSVQVGGTAGTFTLKPAIQVASVRPDNPEAWTVISGAPTRTGAGEVNTGNLDVSALTAGKMFARFGLAYCLGGTAPTVGQADAEV